MIKDGLLQIPFFDVKLNDYLGIWEVKGNEAMLFVNGKALNGSDTGVLEYSLELEDNEYIFSKEGYMPSINICNKLI
jgi:hypothetical protein